MINGGNFLTFIGKNYSIIKRKISFWGYRNGQKLNEDVFHNTIINCNDSVINNNLSFINDKEVYAYIFSSYRTNIMRERLYSNNKPKNELYETARVSDDSYITQQCDISIIKDCVVDEFGDSSYNILMEHINGESTKELEEKHRIKNMKGKIKKIKNFIADKFFNNEEGVEK